MAEQVQDAAKPVYIPWKTFEGYIGGLKGTIVPHKLDTSAKPTNMNGSLWRQVTSALQFLDLIDSEKKVRPELEQLAAAHGTEEWGSAIKEHVLPAYSAIVEGLPLENATQGQLNKCFRENGHVDGQMQAKCVRFYVHALKDSGTKYSPHFSMRQESSSNGGRKKQTRKKAVKKRDKPDDPGTHDEVDPKGTVRYPLYFRGKPQGFIVVPEELDAADCKVIELQLAVLRAYAGEE